MIQDHDRSYYIGASDTIYVIGNWETASFEKWWGTKSGLYSSDFQNDATYRNCEKFLLKKASRAQVQVEMYGSGIRRAFIVSYGLEKEDYGNFYRDIDLSRITMHEQCYDEEFIQETYLPRLEYLSCCLDKGTFPIYDEFVIWQKSR